MPLDDAGMHRAGLGLIFRITPVLTATLLYGKSGLIKIHVLAAQWQSYRFLPRFDVYCDARSHVSSPSYLLNKSVFN